MVFVILINNNNKIIYKIKEEIMLEQEKKKFAKIIRIVSVPPFMFLFFICVLLMKKSNIFISLYEVVFIYLLIGVIPLLAYPLSNIVKMFSDQSRDGQRELAFMFTLVGYTLAAMFSYFNNSSLEVQLITYSYCLSVYVLTLFNKFFHIKASGHACSFTAPIVLSIMFFGYCYLVIGILLSALIIWASLYLKRHTVKELVTGALISIFSIFVIYLVI